MDSIVSASLGEEAEGRDGPAEDVVGDADEISRGDVWLASALLISLGWSVSIP